MTTTDPKPVLNDETIYLGDNGRAYCGEHSGCSARYTGRDISGQSVMKVTPRMLHDEGMPGFSCEDPSCSRRVDPSPIIRPRRVS
jgi:hypothetical protein